MALWPKLLGRAALSLDHRVPNSYLLDMAILPILEAPDPRLKLISKPVTSFDAGLRSLVEDMFETMYDAPGIGLAAIQVGVAQRVLVIDLQEKDEETGDTIRDPLVFINPEILEVSEEFSIYNEGCLSVPEQYADVARPAVIRARWFDVDGKEYEEELDGLLATCLQHEMDHLQGILFVDRISKLKRDMLMKKLIKMRKAA